MGGVAQGVSLGVRRRKRGSRVRGNDIGNGVPAFAGRTLGVRNDIGITLAIAGI